jgi:uncharacterized protein with HEPN domain
MEQRDRQALEDILDVLDRALEFPIPDSQILEDTTFLQDAVIRCLEVLGEATKRLSREIRIEHTQVPWRAMAGMRDVLIHAYDQIDLEEVWMAYQLFPKIRSQVAEILEQKNR